MLTPQEDKNIAQTASDIVYKCVKCRRKTTFKEIGRRNLIKLRSPKICKICGFKSTGMVD